MRLELDHRGLNHQMAAYQREHRPNARLRPQDGDTDRCNDTARSGVHLSPPRRTAVTRLLGRLLEGLVSQPRTDMGPSAQQAIDWPEATVKHLEFIQAVIARQASNGSLAKGWAITIAAVFFGFAVESSNAMLALTSLSTTLVFWGLDAYFLYCERQFRQLYERVRLHDPDVPRFYMNATDRAADVRLRHRVREWIVTLFRFPVLVTYLGLALAACLITWALLLAPEGWMPPSADLASPSAELRPLSTDVIKSPDGAE